MVRLTWKDGIQSRGRRRYLMVVSKGTLKRFRGSDMPGIMVDKAHFTKKGKWSSTEYTLIGANGIRFVPYAQAFDGGSSLGGLAGALNVAPTFEAIAVELGVGTDDVDDYFRTNHIPTWAHVQVAKDALAKLEYGGIDVAVYKSRFDALNQKYLESGDVLDRMEADAARWLYIKAEHRTGNHIFPPSVVVYEPKFSKAY